MKFIKVNIKEIPCNCNICNVFTNCQSKKNVNLKCPLIKLNIGNDNFIGYTKDIYPDLNINYQIDFSNTKFQGAVYEAKYDSSRLAKQVKIIFEYMKNGEWHTLSEIEANTHAPQSSISAQLRNLRKKPHCLIVNKRARGNRENGLFEYQLLIN